MHEISAAAWPMQVSLVEKKGQAEGPNARRIQKPSVTSRVLLACVKRKEGGKKEREVGSSAVLIPRESGGGPVHAPCLMRRPRFPDAHLPFVSLPLFLRGS
jgi:hypothetical protein